MSDDFQKKCDAWRQQNPTLLQAAREEGLVKLMCMQRWDPLQFLWQCEDWFVANFPACSTAEERIAQQVPLTVLRQLWTGLVTCPEGQPWYAAWSARQAEVSAARVAEETRVAEEARMAKAEAARVAAPADRWWAAQRAAEIKAHRDAERNDAQYTREWIPHTVTFEMTDALRAYASLVETTWTDMLSQHALTEKKWVSIRNGNVPRHIISPPRIKDAAAPTTITLKLDERFRVIALDVLRYRKDQGHCPEGDAWREVLLRHLHPPGKVLARLYRAVAYDPCEDDAWSIEAAAWEWPGAFPAVKDAGCMAEFMRETGVSEFTAWARYTEWLIGENGPRQWWDDYFAERK